MLEARVNFYVDAVDSYAIQQSVVYGSQYPVPGIIRYTVGSVGSGTQYPVLPHPPCHTRTREQRVVPFENALE